MSRPTPTQSESPFGFDELFFSTTNERGVIQLQNDVFVRVSGYPQEKLKGAPHSIIRHPDVPRAVFKLLWDTLKAEKPIAAFVKNMAANGNYYWVYAFVFPIKDGYLSIRIKPSSDIFKAAQGLYASTLQVEDKEGMEGSVPFLLDQIKKAGFQDYTDFMIQAAFAELSILSERNKDKGYEEGAGISGEITKISHETSEQLKDSLRRVREFQEINQSFTSTMETLTQGFQHLKYIALNMTISAGKFGDIAASLGIVAKEFSDLSEEIKSHLSGLADFVHILTSTIQKCALRIVSLEVQMMMVDFFVKESISKVSTSTNAFAEMTENKDNFSSLFREYTNGLNTEVASLIGHLKTISEQMSEVKRFTTGLEVIRQIGAVESARVNEVKQTFVHYLEEMQKFITLLQSSNTGIQNGVRELEESCHEIVKIAEGLVGHVDTIFCMASKLSSEGCVLPEQSL